MKQTMMLVAGLFGLLIFASTKLYAQAIEPITAPEVKRLLEDNPQAMLIHALSSLEFEIQHIPGSVNIPTNGMDKTELLPADKNRELIFYCMGVRCKYSYLSALKAQQLGYKRVHWFKGGIPEWRKYDYPMNINKAMSKIVVKKLRVNEVENLIKQQNAFILDVRPFWFEGTQKYLLDSINIPLLELKTHIDKVPKDRPIIVADAFMKQSVSAAKYLKYQGYEVLGVLRGGINKWEKADMPVVKKSQVPVLNPEKGLFEKDGKVISSD